MSHRHNFWHKVRKAALHDTRAIFAPTPRTIHGMKHYVRDNAKTLVVVNRVVGVGASAVAGYFGGAAAGEAVAYGFSRGGGYLRAVQARNEGIKGQDARHLGNKEKRREFIYNSYGAGGGAVASGITTAVAGGTAAQSVQAVGVGQGGQALLGSPGIASAATPATAPTSGIPGLVTPADLAAGSSTAPGSGVGGSIITSYSQLGLTPATGGGFLGGSTGSLLATGGGVLSAIVGPLAKALLGGGQPAGGHAMGEDAGGGGAGSVGGSGDDSSGNPLMGADGKPKWALIAAAAVGAFFIYKAVKRG